MKSPTQKRSTPPLLLLTLDMPPTANSYYSVWQGRVKISDRGRLYRQHVLETFLAERDNYDHAFPLIGRLSCSLVLHGPTKKKYDIDNRVKPLLDALEKADVFDDDEAIDAIHVYRGEIVKHGMCIAQLDQMP